MITDMSPLTKQSRHVLAPLGAAEERRAIVAALASRASALDRLRVRGVELIIDKPTRRGEVPTRRVRVLISACAESVVHEVLVDQHGHVISEHDLGPCNLPYDDDEVDEARTVAERDEWVAKCLTGYPVRVARFAPVLGTSRHRLVGLHFLNVSNPAIPQPLSSVVVDLATGQLVQDGDDHHQRGGG